MNTDADQALWSSAGGGARDDAFFGHPRGLGVLAFTEGWIDFSLYGMQSLLVLYMTGALLRPDHVGHILGFDALLAVLKPIYGPLHGEPLASAIMGLFVALIWATPLLGGLLADRVLGQTPTIVLGCLLMTVGHFLMAFDASFLLALLCLILGIGLGACTRAQVGALYGPTDARRADAFQIYQLAVNLAVIISPLICGTLGESYHWHWGFAAAGGGMLIGLVVYLAGRGTLPPEPSLRCARGGGPARRLATGDVKVVALLLLLLPVIALVMVGNTQIFNAYLIWSQENYRLTFFGHTMPVSWLLSLDAASGVPATLLALMFWRWWGRRHPTPNELSKMVIGAAIMATAPLCLAAAAWTEAGRHMVGLQWGIAFHLINSVGFASLYPVGMALYSRLAPRAFGATLVNSYSLSLFLSNLLAGWLGGLLIRLPGATFWLLHAGLVATGAVLLLTVSWLSRRIVTLTVVAPQKLDGQPPW